YYYDTKLEECLPFRYEGCGGNKNNYQTPSSCYQACAKVDTERHSCGGGEKATGRCKSIKDCSKGSVCRMKTLRSGVCCERKREGAVFRNLFPVFFQKFAKTKLFFRRV
ncbi:Kunitz/Bovine pancreatic trypsin inhibitor domain protein, partial [Oesophagostomum dentatum]